MDYESHPASGNGRGTRYRPEPVADEYGQWESHTELRDYVRILMKRRRVIILAFIGVVTSAAVYVGTAPRIYSATARVQVLQPQPTLATALTDTSKQPEVSLKTEVKYVQSSLIIDKTVQRLHDEGHKEITAADVGGGLRVAIEEPDVLAISVEQRDPARAPLIANAVLDTYIAENTTVARAEAHSATMFLEEQKPRLEREVKQAEDQIREFKKKYNIPETDPVSEQVGLAALTWSADADRAQADADAARAELESLRSQLAAEKPTRMVPHIVDDPVAEALRQQIATAEMNLTAARAQYQETHPRVQVLKETLDNLRAEQQRRYGSKMSSFRSENVEETNPTYEMLSARVHEQETRLSELTTRAQRLAELARQKSAGVPHSIPERDTLARLEHAKDVAEKAYLGVLDNLQQQQLIEMRLLGSARKVDVAQRPSAPIRPQPIRTLTLAIIVGLIAGVSLALLQEYADTSIHDPDDLMLRTGISSLGFIPAARDPGINVKITARSPKSPIAEGFRSIRSNLKFAHLDQPLRTLSVTSAGSGEGKSFTAANLAIVFAQAGIKTVLVDADLRRPSLHRTFGFDHAPGLTNILAGEVKLEDVLHSTGINNLEVLGSGSVPPNPSELLDSRRMGDLIETLKQYAEVVIFDTPPALVVTDAVVLSSRVDSTILVVEQGRVSSRALDEVRHLIEQARGRVAGAIINKVKAGSGDYYYYYYYYRYYYYYGGRDGKRLSGRRGAALPDASEEPAALSSGGDRDL